jgi:drug/metabolite transporter (DMT)-like permease
LALARFSIASPLLVGYTLFSQKGRISGRVLWKKDFCLFTALALTGVTLLYILQFYSLEFITSTAGSILINLNVIFTTLLSVVFLKEPMRKRKATGVLLAFAGVIILATDGKLTTGLGSFQPIGVLLMVGAAFCWAAYSILSKNALDRYSAGMATSITFCLGTFCLLPFIAAEASTRPLMNASWITWISILYLAIPSSAIAYLLWNYMLTRVEVTKLVVSLYAIPIPTAIFSYMFLGETITQSLVLGGVLVILGIYLTESSRNNKKCNTAPSG